MRSRSFLFVLASLPALVAHFVIGILILAPASASANPRCELSFEHGRYDVCRMRTSPEDPLAGLVEEGRAGPRYRVVKWEETLPAALSDQFRGVGIEVLGYLPHHAYLLRLGEGASLPAGIRPPVWSGPFLPAWKVGPTLRAFLAQGSPLAEVPITLVLHPGEGLSSPQARLAALGARAGHRESGKDHHRLVLSVPALRLAPVVRGLAVLPEVAALRFRPPFELRNATADWLHQSAVSGVTPIFDQGIYGCGETVGVLDSGVDYSHCAFWDPVLGAPPVESCSDGALCDSGSPDNGQRKVLLYYKWSSEGDALGDGVCDGLGGGHGTHVAASLAGDDLAEPVDCLEFTTSGDGRLDGTAPGAKLIAQEMGGAVDYLNTLGGTIYHAASTAYAGGARIHSNSWGGGCCFLGLLCLASCEVSYDSAARDADQVMWDFPELLVSLAAGNDGTCCAAPASIGSPGIAKNVLTVGASQKGLDGESLASFSSRGSTLDGRTKPDVLAQGQDIESAASDGVAGGTPGCDGCVLSGTSMATPTAAGLAALVREYLRRGFYPSGAAVAADALPNPSAALIKALLINGGLDMTGAEAGKPVPNQNEGWGRIHLDDALYFAADSRRLWLEDHREGLVTGEAFLAPFQVDSLEELSCTLAWTDYPAILGAAPALVNDLRLELVDPEGEVWSQKLPTSGDPNPFSDTSTQGYDGRNTVERIRLAEPSSGVYELRVMAVEVPMGKRQGFAVACTGAFQDGQPAFFTDGFEAGDTSAWPESTAGIRERR